MHLLFGVLFEHFWVICRILYETLVEMHLLRSVGVHVCIMLVCTSGPLEYKIVEKLLVVQCSHVYQRGLAPVVRGGGTNEHLQQSAGSFGWERT